MITLKGSIEIKTTPEKVFDWFKHLDKHYKKWHPDHVKWINETGGLDEGNVYYEEYLHVKLYKIRSKIIKIEKNKKVEFANLFQLFVLRVRLLNGIWYWRRNSMRREIKIPDLITSRTEYKRKFTLREMYWAFVMIPSAVANMIGNKRKKLIGRDFIERIQLAVTEVNGCAVCSYAHTYMALKQGMSSEEITSFLSGDGKFIKREEAKAIIFAQHFADTRGLPKKDAYNAIVEEYGEEKAKIILSAAQLMMAGNIVGIPYSAFLSRLKGKPYKNSSLIYELGMQIAGFVMLPIALIHGFLRMIMGIPNIRLYKNSKTIG